MHSISIFQSKLSSSSSNSNEKNEPTAPLPSGWVTFAREVRKSLVIGGLSKTACLYSAHNWSRWSTGWRCANPFTMWIDAYTLDTMFTLRGFNFLFSIFDFVINFDQGSFFFVDARLEFQPDHILYFWPQFCPVKIVKTVRHFFLQLDRKCLDKHLFLKQFSLCIFPLFKSMKQLRNCVVDLCTSMPIVFLHNSIHYRISYTIFPFFYASFTISQEQLVRAETAITERDTRIAVLKVWCLHCFQAETGSLPFPPFRKALGFFYRSKMVAELECNRERGYSINSINSPNKALSLHILMALPLNSPHPRGLLGLMGRILSRFPTTDSFGPRIRFGGWVVVGRGGEGGVHLYFHTPPQENGARVWRQGFLRSLLGHTDHRARRRGLGWFTPAVTVLVPFLCTLPRTSWIPRTQRAPQRKPKCSSFRSFLSIVHLYPYYKMLDYLNQGIFGFLGANTTRLPPPPHPGHPTVLIVLARVFWSMVCNTNCLLGSENDVESAWPGS